MVLLGACGGETGPSYSGSIDSLTLVNVGTDSRAILTSTLFDVFKTQGFAMPTPVSGAAGATPPVRAVERAVGYLERIGRLADLHGLPRSSADRPTPSRGPGAGASFMTCQPIETGVDEEGYAIDSDADGIPDDYSADFGAAGCSISDEGFVRNFKGKFRLEDTEIGFLSYRFTSSHLLTRITYGGTGEYVSREVDGVETASFAAAGATHSLDVDILVRINTYAQKQNASLHVEENSSFTANGATLALGGPLPDGTIEFGGEYVLLEEGAGGKNYRFVLTTPQVMSYTTACGTFTDGFLVGKINGNGDARFVMDWTKCNTVQIQYLGFE